LAGEGAFAIVGGGVLGKVFTKIQIPTTIAVMIIAINKAIACRAGSGLFLIFSKEFQRFMGG